MTDDRWMSGETEVTDALRALYAAPTDESYWESLEARILAHVSRRADGHGWWFAMTDLARPALAAAAILIFVAGAAVMHTRQLEVRDAYANVISAAPPSIETAARTASAGDGDAVINYIMSH